MDAAQTVLDQAVLSVAKQLEDQVDEELHRLENLGEDEIDRLRQRRVAEMKKLAAKKQEWLAAGHGQMHEVCEKDFFAEVKGVERVVCLFYRDSLPCKRKVLAIEFDVQQVMEGHLTKLAPQHIETKFLKIQAEKSPFLTDRLKIWMLPTVALVKKGKVDDYVVGFDELGGKESFPTEVLVERLARADAIFADTVSKPKAQSKEQSSVRKGFAYQKTASDEDSDFD